MLKSQNMSLEGKLILIDTSFKQTVEATRLFS